MADRSAVPHWPSSALAATVRVLTRHACAFVVVGAVADALRGSGEHRDSGHPIECLDISPAADDVAIEQLVIALTELDGRRRLAATGCGAAPMRVRLHACPHGTGGYSDLVRAASWVDVAGARLLVAGWDDLIATREAGGRPRDTRALIGLYALPRRGAVSPVAAP